MIQRNKNNTSFKQVSNDWLRHIEPNIKRSTYSKYRLITTKYIIAEMGEKPINSIDSAYIERFGRDLISKDNGKALAYSTANTVLFVLKSIIKYAEQNGEKINVSGFFRLRTEPGKTRVLSEEEQKKLSVHLIGRLNYRYFGILLCMYTGLRIGEICALKESDIIVKDKVLKVSHTMQRLPSSKNGHSTAVVITSPKTPSSNRSIPLPDELFEMIEKLKYPEGSYILTGTEKYMEPRGLQYSFKKVLEEAGVDYVNFHTLRHTFATRCVELGFDVKTLSEILGHSSVNVTMNRYVHPSMALKRKNMGLLSPILANTVADLGIE